MTSKSQRLNEERLTTFFKVLQAELEAVDGNPAVDRLKTRMRKRAEFHKPSLKLAAVEDFKNLNKDVGNTCVSIDQSIVSNASHFLRVMLERYTTRLDPTNIQVVLDPNILMDRWRFGPGASNGVDGTHCVEKILADMTCTSSCRPLVSTLRRISTYFRLFDEGNRKTGITEVSGSKLAMVPKNEDVMRTIASEPSGNMALQLAAGSYLEGVLSLIGINLSTQQPKNKALALRGSMDGSIATVDLKSASDRIVPDLVRLLFPSEWYELLMALRSPEAVLPGGDVCRLNMISTMGNGYTFPLMTLIICALLYGYRCTRGGPNLFIDWGNSAVFGDDIIIPGHEYVEFVAVLHGAGFVVNLDKSYHTGPFRESCGGDYHAGVDVTPFYVRSLSTDSEIYVAINQVFEWSARNVMLLPQTLLTLKGWLQRGPFLVPEWHGPDEGFRTPQCPRRYKYLRLVTRRYMVRKDHPFLVPLAAGGYIEAHDGHAFFTPRPYKNEVRVARARLPNGYLDGSDPVGRVRAVSDYIGAYSFLLG